MWPWMRVVLPPGDRRLGYLRTIFVCHVLLMLISFLIVYHSFQTSPDWLHSLLVPYLVGALSLIASFIVLVLISGDATS